MGQHCCCLGGTLEEDERETAPRASRSGARAAAALALRQQRECEGAEAAARAALETAGGSAWLELREERERARLMLSAADTWVRAELAHLDLQEKRGRMDVDLAQALAWGKLREGAAEACRCATETASGSDRGRCSSSGRESDCATPEERSLGEGSGEAHPQRPPDSYEEVATVAERLGQGMFGLVFAGLAKDPELPEKVAVKIFATPEEDEERTRRALSAITGLKHANLVSTYAHGVLPDEKGRAVFAEHSASGAPPAIQSRLHFRWMVMPRGHMTVGWTIRSRKRKGYRFKVKVLTTWAQEAARGLAELHRHHLVHTDLKVENMLLAPSPSGDNFVCQLCDLDSVHGVGSICRAITYRCLDPFKFAEQVRTTNYDWDIWAMGIAAHEVLTQGTLPPGMVEAFKAAERGQFVQIRARQGLPAAVASVLEECWKPAGLRCTAQAFSEACDPRAFHKATPKKSPVYEAYEAVMHDEDCSFEEWLTARLQPKGRAAT
eukprot:TRINITY_DN10036_c0_g2_i1.p1 TRINITY_DN10036_c0_g2~~TRINITY_DN10036_c0_g2_i1.p1  ORF type:complete len:527 (+),score=142.74 TRINITY_DN10036_c0_g2_i1:98-1582(+)